MEYKNKIFKIIVDYRPTDERSVSPHSMNHTL